MSSRAPRPGLGGLRILRVAGIDVRLNVSLIISFGLISASLGAGLFPSWHPEWSAATCWLTALTTTVLFFVSILLHELSHALVGRRFGISVRTITLFMLGGLAQMDSEPRHWRAELFMALAGPAASLLLGVLFLALASTQAPPTDLLEVDPKALLSSFGPLATLLFWLGEINIIIALFNLVPGFPLDGGRVLRAAIWGVTSDLEMATRAACQIGQGFAWCLIAAGFAMVLGVSVPVFGSGTVSGLWLAFIGWFLNNAALSTYRQMVVSKALSQVPVASIMDTRIVSLGPGLLVSEFVEDFLLKHQQRCFPVVEHGKLLGLVTLDDVRRLPREAWPETRARDLMTPSTRLVTVAPDSDASAALEKLVAAGVEQLPVLEGECLLGLVRREGILRRLSLERASIPGR